MVTGTLNSLLLVSIDKPVMIMLQCVIHAGVLAFFKGQKTNPSTRQNSTQLRENTGLVKLRMHAPGQ